MSKQEFLRELNIKLNGLPTDTINSALDYYSEIIEDSIEDGISEEETIKSLGNIDEIADRIIGETPLKKIIKNKAENKGKLPVWAIVLLVIGFPLWFPTLCVIGGISLAISLFFLAIAIGIIVLIVGVIGLGILLVVYSCACFIKSSIVNGLFFIGASAICVGAGILGYGIVKALLALIKKLFNELKNWIKKTIVKRGNENE